MFMSGCKVLAKVTIEGLSTLGKAPVIGTYICAQSAAIPPAAPFVCAAVASATTLGAYVNAAGPAFQKLSIMAANKGCQVVVDIGKDATKIMIVETIEAIKKAEANMNEAKSTFNALHTPEGINWLMNYLQFK